MNRFENLRFADRIISFAGAAGGRAAVSVVTRIRRGGVVRLLLALVASGTVILGSADRAAAGPIECLPETCGWSISVDGSEVGSGGYDIDEFGNVSLANPVEVSGAGFSIQIDSIGGNVDPEIIFGVGATNTSGGTKTFAFSFSLPLAGLTGLIDTEAVLGQTLTAPSESGVTLFPTLGGGLIMDSQDIRFAPFASIDKGVDIGDVLAAGAGATVLDLDTATSQILLSGGGFDVMTVVVAFGLSDNGGVGLSGRVTQTIVPEPGTALLLAAGLGALTVRRRARAI